MADDDAFQGYYYEHDVDGFEDYVPHTKDPGWMPFIITLSYCLLLIWLFPLFIALRQWVKKRTEKARALVREEGRSTEQLMELKIAQSRDSSKFVVPSPIITAQPSVEACYFHVQELASLDTMQQPASNRVVIQTSVARASERRGIGQLFRVLGRSLRAGTRRRRRHTDMLVGDPSAFGLQPNPNDLDDSGVLNVPVVTFKQLERSDSDTVQTDPSTSSAGSDDLMTAVLDDLVECVKDDDYDDDDDDDDSNVPEPNEIEIQDVGRDESITAPYAKYGISLFKGRRPFFRYFLSKGFRRKVRKCASNDFEMHKILKLATPFTLHAIANDLCDLLEVIIISQLLGTAALSAYFAVGFMVTLSTMVMHGAMSSLTILCSQAIGANNPILAGRYVQTSVLFHQLIFLPIIVIGWNRFDDVVVWLGFDEETGQTALQYARFAFVSEAVHVYDEAIHYILDVTERENYSSILDSIHSVVNLILIVIVIVAHRDPELWMAGAINVAMVCAFLVINLVIVVKNKWLDEYWEGIAGSICLIDRRAVLTFVKTALPLSLGFVVEYCEWEVLFIFASVQGPAEVAVWGLLGSVWEVAENIGVAVADAAEIRVSILLGRGKPAEARYSAHKSIFVGIVTSCFMSLAILSLSKYLSLWMTPDKTLQGMFRELLPQLCVGLAILTFGSMSWSILCVMCLIGSIGVTFPCAIISTFVLNYNLHGLVTSVVLGYATSSALISFYMVNTNWVKIANKVNKRNKKRTENSNMDQGPVVVSTDDDSCNVSVDYDDYDWDELPEYVKDSALFLGYTEIIWDQDLEVDGLNVSWTLLSARQKEAAKVLGFDQVKWDNY